MKNQITWQEKVKKEREESWKKLSEMKVIPATIENIKTVLHYLNEQNWGTWKLPVLSISYSANQYDCDGKIATTIKLDIPVSDDRYGIKNEKFFKVGGKRGHLSKYQLL